jgi:hypothetical protein
MAPDWQPGTDGMGRGAKIHPDPPESQGGWGHNP